MQNVMFHYSNTIYCHSKYVCIRLNVRFCFWKSQTCFNNLILRYVSDLLQKPYRKLCWSICSRLRKSSQYLTTGERMRMPGVEPAPHTVHGTGVVIPFIRQPHPHLIQHWMSHMILRWKKHRVPNLDLQSLQRTIPWAPNQHLSQELTSIK